jgi:hypothetical protein
MSGECAGEFQDCMGIAGDSGTFGVFGRESLCESVGIFEGEAGTGIREGVDPVRTPFAKVGEVGRTDCLAAVNRFGTLLDR